MSIEDLGEYGKAVRKETNTICCPNTDRLYVLDFSILDLGFRHSVDFPPPS